MKWLTQKEIRAAARSGDKEALDCSIEHWRQLSEATEEDLKEAYISGRVGIDSNYCALCERTKLKGEYCNSCPISVPRDDHYGCAPEYSDVYSTFFEWRRGIEGSFPAFQCAARKMLKKLESVREATCTG